MQPIDPVALGLCRQSELDAAVAKAAKSRDEVMTDDERRKLVSTSQSLGMETEPRLPTAIEGLETFSLSDPRGEDEEDTRGPSDFADADSFFNLPAGSDDDEDEDEDDTPRR